MRFCGLAEFVAECYVGSWAALWRRVPAENRSLKGIVLHWRLFGAVILTGVASFLLQLREETIAACCGM